ncbi:MAG: acylphosphatase [Pseudomonadota bacterium]
MSKRVHIYLSGRVQGVFFRASTKEMADSLGVTGIVRNLPDGRVEIIAEGDTQTVGEFVSWCRKGPPGAGVEAFSITEETCRDEYRDFAVVRSRVR